ncbi:unnamed protein product [Jaminaea pallidilutea]
MPRSAEAGAGSGSNLDTTATPPASVSWKNAGSRASEDARTRTDHSEPPEYNSTGHKRRRHSSNARRSDRSGHAKARRDTNPRASTNTQGSDVDEGRERSQSSDHERQNSPDALSCLVSVALEERREAAMDEQVAFHLHELLPSDNTDAEAAFMAGELSALQALRASVRQQLRSSRLDRQRTTIRLWDRELVDRLVKRYYTYMGSGYPITHEVTTYWQVESIYAGSAPLEASFTISMMLAISLASITRSHRSNSEVAAVGREFYAAARKSLDSIIARPGVERLQAVLFVLMYSMLVPNSGDAPSLSATAIHFAIELNLYSDAAIQRRAGRDHLYADILRRLFCTAYNVDRGLSIITGRPSSLSDHWITTQPPLAVEDVDITREGVHANAPVCQLKVGARQHFKLRQMQSQIQSRLYSPGRDESAGEIDEVTAVWSWEMYERLRAWRIDFKYPTPFLTREWVRLQFNLTTTYLFRASPKRPSPDPEAMHVTLHSSSETLKLYKALHRNLSINFSWMATQNLFMSGIVFLRSLRGLHRAGKMCPSITFVDSVLQVQACASVLEALALSEGNSGRRVRDAFERVSSLIIENLEKLSMGSPSSMGDASSPASRFAEPRRLGRPGHEGVACQQAAIAKEDSTHYALAAPETRSDAGGSQQTDIYRDHRHFYRHDTEASRTDSQRFSHLPRHLYILTSVRGAQVPQQNRSAGFNTLFSRAPSPSGQRQHDATTSGEDVDISSKMSQSDSSMLSAAARGQDHMSSQQGRMLPPALHQQSHYHDQVQLSHVIPGGAQSAHVPSPADWLSLQSDPMGAPMSMESISSQAGNGWLDEAYLASWAMSAFSQSPSSGIGLDLASENAMVQALGLSLPAEPNDLFSMPPVSGDTSNANRVALGHDSSSHQGPSQHQAQGSSLDRAQHSTSTPKQPQTPGNEKRSAYS